MDQCSAACRKQFRMDTPPGGLIQRWSDNFENQGCICKKKSSGRPRVSNKAVWRVEATFSRRPRKSVRKGSHEFQMPKTTVCQVLCRRVCMKPNNSTLSNRWIGRAGATDEEWLKWPPRSPDLTPCDFFLWGYVKEQVFVPPLLLDIDELKLRNNASIETTDRNTLERVWDELDNRLDICRDTHGAHM
jgi:hypothetical protein